MYTAQPCIASDRPAPRVLVLHGIWNPRLMVWPVVRHLRAAGMQANAFGYPTVLADPRHSLPLLRAQILEQGIDSLVGYSLGGVMSLLAVQDWVDNPVRRIVCLGSPLRGSGTARWLCQRRASLVLGHSSDLLHAGIDPAAWQAAGVQVGMVAGVRPLGIGRLLGAQGRRSDGTVALRETRWPGLAAHCVVGCSHTGLPAHRPALAQVAAFLGQGAFRPRAEVGAPIS